MVEAQTIELTTPESGVRLMRLNRPERLNALTREMVADFNAHTAAIANDSECRILIITGAGRGFCAGQDVTAANARIKAGATGLVERYYWQEQFAGMARGLRNMPQVVIAAVNGACAGAGLSIALGADVRVASRTASFHIASVRLGLTAGESGISYNLPRLVGAARAFDIMLSGRPVDAEEAERIGLCTRLADDGKTVDEALTYARLVLANSPFAVRHTKRLMWQNLEAPNLDAALELENRAQILAAMTDDYKEATAAFTEKRAARFKGE